MTSTASLPFYEIPPEGEHPAYICKVIDLGTQPHHTDGQVDYLRRQVLISFVLAGTAKKQNGKQFQITRAYTASMLPGAPLRRDMENAFGSLSATGVYTFDMSSILGRACLATIKHVNHNEQSKAHIDCLSPLSPSTVMQKMESEVAIFDLSKPDFYVFRTLSGSRQKIIASSPEWQDFLASQRLLNQTIGPVSSMLL